MPLTDKRAYRKDLTSGLGELQHRHFATIATIIREEGWHSDATRTMVAVAFADRLWQTNRKFNRNRFLRACQPY